MVRTRRGEPADTSWHLYIGAKGHNGQRQGSVFSAKSNRSGGKISQHRRNGCEKIYRAKSGTATANQTRSGRQTGKFSKCWSRTRMVGPLPSTSECDYLRCVWHAPHLY